MDKMLALILLLVAAILVGGCDYLMPTVEKSKTEKRQLEQLELQTEALVRIADALERRDQNANNRHRDMEQVG